MVWVFKSQFEGLSALKRGVHALTKAVTPAFGPRGYNVVIKKGKAPIVLTKNGIRIAKEIILQDAFESLGVKLAKEALLKVVEQTGDGSTTALVVIDALFTQGLKGIAAGLDPQEIKAGILLSVEMVYQQLQRQAIELQSPKDVLHVAMVAANHDVTLGTVVATVISQADLKGVFSSKDSGISKTRGLGKRVKSGYLSPYFVTRPETMDVVWEEALVLILSHSLVSLSEELIRYLELISEQNTHPLVIIAEDFDQNVLRTLILNKLRNGLPVCAVKAPGSRELRQVVLEDLAILTGATLIGQESENCEIPVSLDVLGRVKQVMITKETFTFLEGGGDAEIIQARKQELCLAIARSTSESECQELEERLAIFIGSIPQVQITADTDTEQRERQFQLESALRATKAAMKGGIVPGGGVAFLRAAHAIEVPANLSSGMTFGFETLLQAVRTPLKVLAQNCGRSSEEVIHTILSHENPRFGYNGMTDTFEDLVDAGICDPLIVTTSSLKCAVSVSCLLLTSSFFISSRTKT
ncbi:gGroEL [Chlamydia pneumoniae TW-183]|uniref:60 kDa chaperonin n=1 Tax=Chlamydia pneumoniae TaxID=83558 RepID=A0A0F7XJV8_CHLPN|nr:molecular chaperone GroEL [Chlamydia pneumoniae]AAD18915.1 heat shock protein-60 [Chlamydia pneumoniae CWL029]AAP98734.1 gGroEL [Chlamydia pneumoniae TW-183]CRI33296.1 60 kDa chaperonin 2 [Chlamydia pneumoniae]CRI37286.1 60 kDa chaperonin 2 [Chlamydia pneumoniae]CRI38414.1 60 kDa chaperonin 2 [Chlamydia pneumoniae]